MKLGIFFERDGLLNRVRVERQHQVTPLTLEEFQINEDAIEPLRRLKAAGFVLIATTNQPGLSRGYQCRRELDRMHGQLMARFPLDSIMVCPHEENDHCPCRKPKPGLFVEAFFRWHLDLDHSFVVSDKWQDSEAARNVGCISLLVKSPWVGGGHHDFVLKNLSEVTQKILQLSAPNQGMASYQGVA